MGNSDSHHHHHRSDSAVFKWVKNNNNNNNNNRHLLNNNNNFGEDDPHENEISTKKSTQEEITAKLCQVLINKSKKDDVGENVSRKAFLGYLSSEKGVDFNCLLYDFVTLSTKKMASSPSDPSEAAGRDFASKTEFCEFCETIRNLITDSQQLNFYVSVFSKGKEIIERRDIENLFRTCFLLEAEMVGGSKNASCCLDTPLLASVSEAISLACVQQGEKTAASSSLQHFLRKHFPNMIHGSVHRWLLRRVTSISSSSSNNNNNNSSSQSATTTTTTNNKRNCKSNATLWCRNESDEQLLHPVLAWLFANTLPELYNSKPRPPPPTLDQLRVPLPGTHAAARSALSASSCSLQCQFDPRQVITTLMQLGSSRDWELLYSTESHGHSMNRLQHHVFSYRGPTAMILKTDGDVMLCVAVDQEWRERPSRWGGSRCTAMQITPFFKVFEVGEKLMYFNLTSRGHPKGLLIGQNPKNLVLEIDEDLCLAKVKKIPYKLELLEIWGCAGTEIKEQQQKQKKWEMSQVEKHRKVNVNAVDWKDNPDRYILELAGRPSYGANFKR